LIIPKIRTYEHNIHLNCLQFLSEIFFNLYPYFIVPPQFAGGNLMGKNDETEDITMCKINSTQTFRQAAPVSKHNIY
jgi:hypothetical protein